MFDLTAYRIESYKQGWLRYLYFKIFNQKPPESHPELNWLVQLELDGNEIDEKSKKPEEKEIDTLSAGDSQEGSGGSEEREGSEEAIEDKAGSENGGQD